ncbi:MAG: FecR domain-containing protein [Bacteroidales bacterium]
MENQKEKIKQLSLGFFDDEEAQSMIASGDAECLFRETWNSAGISEESQAFDPGKEWKAIQPLIRHRDSNRLFRITRIAASVMIPLLLAGAAWFFLGRSLEKETTPVSYTTADGERSRITLTDGSAVWLNGASELQYIHEEGKNSRLVNIKGEAYFEVSKGKNPFLVRTGDVEISVTGTRFNVNAYPENKSVQVTLVEGSVMMGDENNKGAAKTALRPGQKGDFSIQSRTMLITAVDTALYTSWIEGKLSFDNQYLEEIIEALEKRYHTQISMAPELMGKYRYTLTIKDEPLDDVLTILQLTSPIRFIKSEGKIIIRKK